MFKKYLLAGGAAIALLGFTQKGRVVGAAENTGSSADLTDTQIRDVITRVAHHQIHELKDGDYTPVDSVAAAKAAARPQGIMWNYPWGVTLYGMFHTVDATGDKEAEKFALEHNAVASRYYVWLDGTRKKLGESADLTNFFKSTALAQLMRLGNLDSCGSMGAQLMEGILRHGGEYTPEARQVAERVADYIAQRQARTADGTFWRPEQGGGTIWLDDLYMSCPMLVRWSEKSRDPALITDCAHQVLNMAARLQDKDGLFYHGYYENEKRRSPLKWGRANGWTMVATVEILSAMPQDHPDRAKLLEVLRRQIEGIEAVQAPSGMWRQVLDHPELWEETSCTAMFSYSIARAVNRGWIDHSHLTVARKAFQGICQHVTPEGAVNGTCEGTGIGRDLKFYAERKRPDDDLHGRGPVMLAGAELLLANKP